MHDINLLPDSSGVRSLKLESETRMLSEDNDGVAKAAHVRS